MEHILKSRYKIGPKISESPFSVTYKGFFIGTDRPVIIKIYKRGTLNSSLIKNMKQKVRDLSQIESPGIAALLDGDYGWQGFYYVREFVEGTSLKEILAKEGKLEPARATALVCEITRALETAHQKGILHGALSPSNIFIDKEGVVKLTDFVIEGEVKQALPLKVLSIMEGSRYLSPEELEGQSATPASDIYVLGLILYEMLTGTALFSESGLGTAIRKLKENFLSVDLPRYLKDIIARATQRDQLLRFRSGSHLRRSLEAKGVVESSASAEELVEIFNSCVSQDRSETNLEVPQPFAEEGRLSQKWSIEKYRARILAVVIATLVILGLLYAFLFVR